MYHLDDKLVLLFAGEEFVGGVQEATASEYKTEFVRVVGRSIEFAKLKKVVREVSVYLLRPPKRRSHTISGTVSKTGGQR